MSFQRFCLIAAFIVAAAASALAQDYPTRPIMLVVPFPAGGGNDAAVPEHGHLGTDAEARAESQRDVAQWLAR